MYLQVSLPSRERGLKCRLPAHRDGNQAVAPFTGAWIEMKSIPNMRTWPGVAPFTGAWIEISATMACPASCPSLPSRERGLKYQTLDTARITLASLPSRERGLKSDCMVQGHRRRRSLPSRERGLKYRMRRWGPRWCQSLPSRERGLKYDITEDNHTSRLVAPFTGAWIEIRSNTSCLQSCHVAPFTGAWIEI